MEATNEARTAEFFLKAKVSNINVDINGNFFKEIARTCNVIIEKLKELNNK